MAVIDFFFAWNKVIIIIIDFHTHCFPDKISARAVAALAERANTPPRLDGTVGDIRRSMKRVGVDASVVLSIATKPEQTENINNWSAQIQGNGIVAFGSIHPLYENWENELKRLRVLGLKGLKFHPDYQQFFVDDQNMYPIYEEIARLGLIMVFHCGVDIGLPSPYHCEPERLIKVIREFPKAKIVAAHMGGYACWDDVEKYLVGENVYLDTAYSLEKMDTNQLLRMVKNHDYRKILFATDSPWCDQEEEIDKLKRLYLDSDKYNAIIGNNAENLLSKDYI